jgi:uncharacterized protein
MLELIKTLHTEFQTKLSSIKGGITKRFIELPVFEGKVSVAIGMRRVGKTYALYQEINKLLASNIPISQILYIDFEDDRIQPLSQKDFGQLLDSFYKLYPENHEKLCYLFLDEVQTIEDWPLVIRRYLNTKNTKIYLTGSSAKLLSKEIATSMRGRSMSVEVWPYSFYEYLTAKDLQHPGKVLSQKDKDIYSSELLEYISCGGFPEVATLPEMKRIQVLRDYVDLVTYKDIIERHNISNTSLIKRIISYLLKNTSTSLSINKYFNDLKSQGFKVGRSTIYDYLGYIEDAYLAFSVPLFDESIRKTQHNPKKIYSIDSGLSRVNQLSINPNYGRLFENLIYLDLRRMQCEIYYYLTKDKYEVDFLTKSLDGTLNLYQVCWDISDKDTKEREQRALDKAVQELGIKGTLITADNYLDWIRTNFTNT